jgi:hypothetical protein
MRLFVDLDSLNLVRAENDRARVALIEQKRGDAAEWEIVFLSSGARTVLPAGTAVIFGAKAPNKYDSEPIVYEAGFVLTDEENSPHYLALPSFNTEQLNELLNLDGDDTNDLTYVDLMGEITWGVPQYEKPTSTKTFRVRVHNDVVRGDEGTPTGLPTIEDWLTARAVRVDGVQELTDEQKTRGRANLGLGTAAIRDTGTEEGEIPLLGIGGKLPPSVIPPLSLTSTLGVANTAARLALTSEQATGNIIVEADTGKSYGLVSGGDPTNSGDWILIGDGAISIGDVDGLAGELAGKSTAFDTAAQISNAFNASSILLPNAQASHPKSAMSRDLVDEEMMFTSSQIRTVLLSEGAAEFATSGTGVAGRFGNSPRPWVHGSTTASAWQRYNFCDLDRGGFPFSGGGPPCAVPIAISVSVTGATPADAGTSLVFGYINDWSSPLPPTGSDLLAIRGFAFRIFWSNANSRFEIMLSAHNGTSITNSAPVQIPLGIVITRVTSFIISSNGAGTVRLYSGTPSDLYRISRTPIATISGGPTDGEFINRFSIGLVNGTTPPASNSYVILADMPKIHINQTTY